ncbi:MAG: hypothetical protein R2932_26680 [Caldilineaceae bacterium]
MSTSQALFSSIPAFDSTFDSAFGPAFGTGEWYAVHWRNRWSSLQNAIRSALFEIDENVMPNLLRQHHESSQTADQLSLRSSQYQLYQAYGAQCMLEDLLVYGRVLFEQFSGLAAVTTAGQAAGQAESAAPTRTAMLKKLRTAHQQLRNELQVSVDDGTVKQALDELVRAAQRRTSANPETLRTEMRWKRMRFHQAMAQFGFELLLDPTATHVVLSAIDTLLLTAGQAKLQAELGEIWASLPAQQQSPNYLLDTLLDQASKDLILLLGIVTQRANQTLRHNLILVDTMADLALNRAVAAGYVDSHYSSVLTYLDRRLSVRLVPYHNTILIGMPPAAWAQTKVYGQEGVYYPIGYDPRALSDGDGLSVLPVATDFLALPHEIGHLIFDYGKLPDARGGGSLADALAEKLEAAGIGHGDWRRKWLEEIFCDAVSCLIAGPISVLSFQLLLSNERPPHRADVQPTPTVEKLTKYPFPALRPLIQSQIWRVDALAAHFPDIADQLDQHWATLITQSWPEWSAQDLRETPIYCAAEWQDVATGAYIPRRGDWIFSEIQPLLDIVLDLLAQLWPAQRAETWTPNRAATNAGSRQQSIAELYWAYVAFAESNYQAALLPVEAESVEALIGQPTSHFDWLIEQAGSGQTQTLSELAEKLLVAWWGDDGPNVGHGG